LGQYQECIINTVRALQVNSEDWLAYADRGFCENGIGEHLKAVDDYRTYLAHNATDARMWFDLGFSQYNAGLLQDSVASYSRSLELDPTDPQAYINRGTAYIKLEKYEAALADFNQTLELGDNPFGYSGRGDAYYGLEKYDLAIVNYKKAISLMPNSAYSYCMLSLTYYEVGQYQEALDAAATSHDINPLCGGQKLIEIQARSYYALGDNQQAILYINRALQLGDYALGYYYRGIMYQAAGQYEDAVLDLKYFISLNKDDSTNKKEIADARARLAELTP